jgi:hypothetical protein
VTVRVGLSRGKGVNETGTSSVSCLSRWHHRLTRPRSPANRFVIVLYLLLSPPGPPSLLLLS